MPDVRTEMELADRIFVDYQQAAALTARREELTAQMQAKQDAILSGIGVYPVSAPDFYIADDRVDPDLIASQPLSYFQELATRNKVDERLATLTDSLSEIAVGRAVTIVPIDPEQTHFRETYYETGIYGSHQQEYSWRTPSKAIGTIKQVLPARNILKVTPIRGKRASINKGHYELPIIGEDGSPLVTIESREPTSKDNPSKVGFLWDTVYSLNPPWRD